MKFAPPNLVARLARQVYTVTDMEQYKDFINTSAEFSRKPTGVSLLQAQIGLGFVKTSNNFTICAAGANEWQGHLFLMFRGTIKSNTHDWLANANTGINLSCGGNLVHAGFNQIFNSIKTEIDQFIRSHPGSHTVHCIGHSLGGAVANLCAEWLTGHAAKTVKLYTFGCPRVGLLNSFATNLENSLGKNNIFRVYRSNDAVAMVPPFPFMHAPRSTSGYYLGAPGFTFSVPSHSMKNYVANVGAHSWQKLYQPAPALNISSIKAWLSGDYDNNPNSVTFWNRLNTALAYCLQTAIAVYAMPKMIGTLTVVDALCMILQKGFEALGEARDWALLVMRKMMRALGMKLVESAEEITLALIRRVLSR